MGHKITTVLLILKFWEIIFCFGANYDQDFHFVKSHVQTYNFCLTSYVSFFKFFIKKYYNRLAALVSLYFSWCCCLSLQKTYIFKEMRRLHYNSKSCRAGVLLFSIYFSENEKGNCTLVSNASQNLQINLEMLFFWAV
jgi:hypothetical protein